MCDGIFWERDQRKYCQCSCAKWSLHMFGGGCMHTNHKKIRACSGKITKIFNGRCWLSFQTKWNIGNAVARKGCLHWCLHSCTLSDNQKLHGAKKYKETRKGCQEICCNRKYPWLGALWREKSKEAYPW